MIAEISYFDAWVHWLHGVDIDGDYMGGLTIKTWGRIGKIAAALSGCVIVLDIIGPGRILRAQFDVLAG